MQCNVSTCTLAVLVLISLLFTRAAVSGLGVLLIVTVIVNFLASVIWANKDLIWSEQACDSRVWTLILYMVAWYKIAATHSIVVESRTSGTASSCRNMQRTVVRKQTQLAGQPGTSSDASPPRIWPPARLKYIIIIVIADTTNSSNFIVFAGCLRILVVGNHTAAATRRHSAVC